jgi:SAM-dependent methyltransferase
MEKSVRIISIETSHQFVRDTLPAGNNTVIVCDDIAATPLQKESVDRVISLAGLHHIMDKYAFFQEAYRVLKPGGIFCIADADHDSKTASFLDTFVDQNSSMGHKGQYLDRNTTRDLETANFEIAHDLPHSYCWTFNTSHEMADYCQLLFGLDLANEAEVIAGIDRCLGCHSNHEQCFMNWGLRFIKAIKLAS